MSLIGSTSVLFNAQIIEKRIGGVKLFALSRFQFIHGIGGGLVGLFGFKGQVTCAVESHVFRDDPGAILDLRINTSPHIKHQSP